MTAPSPSAKSRAAPSSSSSSSSTGEESDDEMTAPSPSPKSRPAPSSSSSSSTGEESDDEMTAPSPSPKSRPAPKYANGSSSAPKPHKPSSTSAPAPTAQSPKPKPSAAAAQVPKPKPSSTSIATQGPKPNPSKPSSTSEDEDDKKEEDSSEDEDGSEEEDPKDGSDEKSSDSESDDNRSNPPPPQPPFKSTTTKASGSGSTDDTGSESSDQSPPSPRRSSRVADPSIKPITSKPMDVPTKLSKPASMAASNQDIKGPNKKKQKVPEASENGSGGQKRQLFQKIWSDEDEISTLQGMIDYHTKKGTVPDMDIFHDFIHKSLQMEVSKTQLADKVRRLKKKYVTAAARGKNGVDPSFTKAHEQTAYELSKKIWGPMKISSKDADGDVGGNSTRKLRKIKEESGVPTSVAMKTNEEDDSVKGKFPYPLLTDAVSQMTNGLPIGLAAKRALELVDVPKAMALENKYKKLRLSEMKHHMHRMDLTKEIVKMTMGAIEKLS